MREMISKNYFLHLRNLIEKIIILLTSEALAKVFICGSTSSPQTEKANNINVPSVRPEPVEGLFSDFCKSLIGFAFRDQYINFMLENTLRRRLDGRNTLWIQCFNSARLDEYPSDSRLPYFADKFKDIFFLYSENFQIKENPLSIIGKALHQRLR
jgi:hypothetical protein